MKEFKIGGKVIISKNESYRIVDIVERNGEMYYFACTERKPIIPKIFKKVNEGDDVYIEFIENSEIIREIAEKIIEESYEENSTETSKK